MTETDYRVTSLFDTCQACLDQILLASYESTRPAADKKAMHGVVNQLEELLEEASHYMGQSNE